MEPSKPIVTASTSVLTTNVKTEHLVHARPKQSAR